MVEKNKEYVVQVISQGYEGEGIAKINESYPIFIEGALSGEVVRVKIIKVNKNFAYGKLMEIIEPSINRVEPICSIYKRCGGCKIQHISYKGQLDFKWGRVRECIERIAKLDKEIVKYPLGMTKPLMYRNKVQLPIGMFNGQLRIGFFVSRSHEIIDMEECFIQDDITNKIVKLTREWIKKFNISPCNVDGEYKSSGVIRHLMIRRGFKTGEVMVVLVTNKQELPYKNEFIKVITKSIPEVKSIIQNVNSKNTNVILGDKLITLWGNDTISDYIGEFKFNISPLSFFQVNPMQTEVLYSKALEYANLTGNETVFDAYCGTGTITLFLSKKAKKVYGVEIIPQAIDNANVNAKENNISNAKFFVGKSEKIIPDLINKGIKADVIVVDPPRKGCDISLLNAISKVAPKRIVYVSCDPSTLARDLKILDENGYKAIEVQPVDMFPQTAHIENVALISKIK